MKLTDRLNEALNGTDDESLNRLAQLDACDRRDRFMVLSTIYALHTAPLEIVREGVRWQHHPAVAAIKQRLESAWLTELEAAVAADQADSEPVATIRALAARDRLPAIYRWVAQRASWEEIVTFLALEGGPDAGFDDLVAACQIGLSGSPKLELARNYWDEMGEGEPGSVHAVLHDQLVKAIGMPRIPPEQQPVSGLERSCLGGLLVTNRRLQPEMLGALGLIELQAGPRCQLVLQGLARCDAPSGAYPFYEIHARVDPRHGRDWLDGAIAPVLAEQQDWASGVVRGARWRAATNAAFFRDIESILQDRFGQAA